MLDELAAVEDAMSKVERAVVLNARDSTLQQWAGPADTVAAAAATDANNKLLVATVEEVQQRRTAAREKLELLNLVLDASEPSSTSSIDRFLHGIGTGDPDDDMASPQSGSARTPLEPAGGGLGGGRTYSGDDTAIKRQVQMKMAFSQLRADLHAPSPPRPPPSPAMAAVSLVAATEAAAELAAVRQQLSGESGGESPLGCHDRLATEEVSTSDVSSNSGVSPGASPPDWQPDHVKRPALSRCLPPPLPCSPAILFSHLVYCRLISDCGSLGAEQDNARPTRDAAADPGSRNTGGRHAN